MEKQILDNSLPFAALSVGQAKALFCNLMQEEFRKIQTPPKEQAHNDAMNLGELVSFLSEHGIPLKRSTIYVFTTRKQIPFTKCGKRIMFSRRDILQWIEDRTTRPETKADAALRLAKSINRKG